MKERSMRTNKGRSKFKLSSLLDTEIQKFRNDYMTLMFVGVFDKTLSEEDVVEVETFLSKISHQKRKDTHCYERVSCNIVKM